VRIDQSVTREILARTDLAALIGQYVSLHKRGRDLVGLCPFHGEKTPSFHVHPDRGFFKCFGCGKGGDAIRFMMELENLRFPDAARMLAKRAGVELVEEDPRESRRRSERESIYDANKIAAAFFHRLLLSDPRAETARRYCEGRGITRATIEAFQLGFSLPEWSALADELRREGVDVQIALAAGLVKARGEGRGVYDVFRNRIMVPTYATTGEVVAFGGRALADENPKYLNTGTTPVYTKGRFVYALNVARRNAAKDNTLIVVEGYLDCIALHQAGFGNAVAALGTAFTPEQAAELQKYATTIFVCYDADVAGQAAARKSISILAANKELSVKIVALPVGEDPDSFVRSQGAAAFQTLLDGAVDAVEFALDRAIGPLAASHRTPAQKAREGERIMRELSPREEWHQRRIYVAGLLKLHPSDLENSITMGDPTRFAPRTPPGARFTRHLAPAPKRVTFERDVIAAFVEEPLLLDEYAGGIAPEAFVDPVLREVLEQLYAARADLRTAADVSALFSERGDVVTLLAELELGERSKLRRFEDTSQRRAFLDRVAVRLDADRRASGVRSELATIEHEITSLLSEGRPIPKEIKERQVQLEDALREAQHKRERREVNT